MKVYILYYYCDFDYYKVSGVYTTKEAAFRAATFVSNGFRLNRVEQYGKAVKLRSLWLGDPFKVERIYISDDEIGDINTTTYRIEERIVRE